MKTRTLEPEQRNELLGALRSLGSDADAHGDILRVFLPLPMHTLALGPRTAIIRGERGVGKTALFHVLERLAEEGIPPQRLFPGLADVEMRWIVGFTESGKEHPAPATMNLWGRQADEDQLSAFWLGHLVGRLAGFARANFARADGVQVPAVPEPFWTAWSSKATQPEAWVTHARATIPRLIDWLDGFDGICATRGFIASVTYDHLDRLGERDAPLRNRFAASLLHLWLSFSNRYRNLRPKIFIRQDLFEHSLRGSADASKLETRSVLLGWNTQDLYRTLLRHILAAPGLAEWLADTPFTRQSRVDPRFGIMPPPTLPEEGVCSQRGLAKRLVGEVMGAGTKKGYVYRWIPTHLQDAHGAVVPRSMLNLVAFAADWALQNGPKATLRRLLTPAELVAALKKTSRQRVVELSEEHEVVKRLENLKGMIVMAERGEVVERLAAPRSDQSDGFGRDGEAVFEELERLGVLKVRSDGRVDVPDLYREGYDIKRKGGAARPR